MASIAMQQMGKNKTKNPITMQQMGEQNIPYSVKLIVYIFLQTLTHFKYICTHNFLK